MSINQILREQPPPTYTPRPAFSPVRILTTLAILIYLAEIVAMGVLYLLDLPNYLVTSLVDGLIMTGLIMPALYFLQLKPLQSQIEERTRAEQALRSSEELFKKVLELLPVGVWIIDQHGKILHGNPAGQKLWAGARYVDIPQYGEYKGWWPDSGKRVAAQEWAAARAITNVETILDEEVNIEAFDGTPRVMLNSAVPILDEQNTLHGAVVLNQDITRRRMMEKNLIQSNELLERLFSSISTLIAYMDRQFNFVRVNDTYARAGGHPVEFYIGKNHFDLYPSEENQAIFEGVIASNEPYSVMEKPFEYPEYPERGVTYWDWSLQPVRDQAGEVQGLVLSLVDVTERKRAELQLESQNQELRQLSSLERHQRELAESLVQASLMLNTSLELEQVLGSILEQVHKTIPFQAANILLLEGESLRLGGSLSVDDHEKHAVPVEASYPLAQYPLLKKACEVLQPVKIDAVSAYPDWRGIPGLAEASSFLTLPLLISGKAVGLLNLSAARPEAFSQQAVDRLMAFAAPAALAIHNALLLQAESNARQVAETLGAAAQALSRSLDLEQVIQTLLDHLVVVGDCDIAGVAMLEDETNLALRAVRGEALSPAGEVQASFPFTGSTELFDFPISSIRQAFTLSESQGHADHVPNHQPPGSWLVVPILASDKFIGLVQLGRAAAQPFNRQQEQFAQALVSQAGVAIQNAWLFQQVSSSSERLQSLTRKLVETQENERFHVARELHDEAGQSLSSLKINLGMLEQDPDTSPGVRRRLGELKGVTDHVLEELHRLAVNLRPVALDHLGLVPALEQLAANLNSASLAVQFKALGFEKSRLPREVETCLYRIVQEALANVVRHAQAANVGILLERGAGRVRLFVEDDGLGFDPDSARNQQRIGLSGMRERAEMFSGRLTIESYPGAGATIIVEVPDVYSHPAR